MRGICFHGFYMCSKILHIICIHILPRCGPSVYCILVNGMLEKAFHAHFPFLSFPACFWIPIFFSNLNSNCSDLLDLINLQEQVLKAFCYQILFWPFTVWTNCFSDLKIFENSRLSALNLKSFSRSLEQFFLTVGQNNFCNKIPFFL